MSKKTYWVLLTLPIAICIVVLSYVLLKDDRKTLQNDKKMGGNVFPAGSYYELTPEGDIIIELDEEASVAGGLFRDGTRFYFDRNNLKKIESFDEFSLGEIEFDQNSQINTADKEFSHQFALKKSKILDGLNLEKGCELRFKRSVLHSSKCPGKDSQIFKRFIELPEVN